MVQKARVCKRYTSEFPYPLIVTKGSKVLVDNERNDWNGWKYCTFNGSNGWIPTSYLDISEQCAIVTKEYDGTELSLECGDIVEILDEEVGWYWCKTIEGYSGWYPKNRLELIASH